MPDAVIFSRYAVVRATFRPRRTDDLKPEGHAAIGWRGLWRVMGVVDRPSKYAGEWQLMPVADDGSPIGDGLPQFAWTPGCDLADVELVRVGIPDSATLA